MAAVTKIAITNVRVFDGHSVGEPRTVVIDGDKIGDDPTGAAEVDGDGGVLIPGLIDSHVHLMSNEEITQLAKWGVTTAFDMACWPADKLKSFREFSASQSLTDIRSAGLPATAPGSTHSRFMPLPETALLSGPSQAAEFVAGRVEEGSDYIKLIADVPGPTQETLNAVVVEAHKHGKFTVAHAAGYTPSQMALEAGVDVLTHVPHEKALDKEFAARMVEQKSISIPTLVVSDHFCNKMKRPGTDFKNGLESVAVMHAAGVPILAGSDANSIPFMKIVHGESLHQELEFLILAGLTPLEALRSATILGAQHFKLNDRGVIEPGKRADLLLIAGNPLEDIKATRQIKRVWCKGVEVNRSD